MIPVLKVVPPVRYDLPSGGTTYNPVLAESLWRRHRSDPGVDVPAWLTQKWAQEHEHAERQRVQAAAEQAWQEEQRAKRRLLHEERNALRHQMLTVIAEHGPDTPLWYVVHNTDLTRPQARMAGAFMTERDLLTRRPHGGNQRGYMYTITDAGRLSLAEWESDEQVLRHDQPGITR